MRRIEQAAFTPIFDSLETLLAQMLDMDERIRGDRFDPQSLADCAGLVEDISLFLRECGDLPHHRCCETAEIFCRYAMLCGGGKKENDTACFCRDVTWPLLLRWFVAVTAALGEKTDPGLRPLLYGRPRQARIDSLQPPDTRKYLSY